MLSITTRKEDRRYFKTSRQDSNWAQETLKMTDENYVLRNIMIYTIPLILSDCLNKSCEMNRKCSANRRKEKKHAKYMLDERGI
jgi:hypothetical protein